MAKRKSEKQLARETAQHICMIKKLRKDVGLHTEMTLLTAATTRQFHGQLIVQDREAAILKAIELSHYKEEQLTFFTDGAVHIPSNEKKQHSLNRDLSGQRHRLKKIRLAAAVAYKAAETSEWTVKSFSVAQGGRRCSLEAELAGIAGALALAISSIVNLMKKREILVISHKVFILTDCQCAIDQLQQLQQYGTGKQRDVHNLACKLITRSQYLHRLGATLEVHWIPGYHEDITGNILVHSHARQTVKDNLNVLERELIEINLLPEAVSES